MSEHGHSHGQGQGHDDEHGHSHGGVDARILRSREAMRTLWLSLIVLGCTAAFQLVVVALSGSVALLADSVHNVGDALTAVPLGAAFLLLRRPASPRLTYGWGRAEDFAGLAVVAIIFFSALYAAYSAVERLVHPSTPSYLLATAAAGIVGFLGNEWVAVYRIRSGRRIGSAALVADGHHARVDGYTSLAVVVGAGGVALGWRLADPIIGLLISLAILRIVWQSLKAVGLRAMDGVEAGTVADIEREATSVPGVRGVDDVRARWQGHTLRVELAVEVDPLLTVRDSQTIADDVSASLIHHIEHVNDVAVRTLAHVDGRAAQRPTANIGS